MSNNSMIDIETLDTRPDAIVFQAAMVVFSDDGTVIEEELFHLDILPQIMKGRTLDRETQKWWMEQPKEAWDRQPTQLITVEAMFNLIRVQMKHHKVGYVWSNSPSFDAVILRSLAEDFGIEMPWTFRSDFDLRTVRKVAGLLGFEPESYTTTHNSLQDCKDQVDLAAFCLARFRDIRDK